MLSLLSCVGRVLVLLAAALVTATITISGEWGEEGEWDPLPTQLFSVFLGLGQ